MRRSGRPAGGCDGRAGDLLYLPRGWLHEAKTGSNQLSLHLTLTVPSHDFTWAKFCGHAISELLMEQTGPLRNMVSTCWGERERRQVPAAVAMGGEDSSEQSAAMIAQVGRASCHRPARCRCWKRPSKAFLSRRPSDTLGARCSRTLGHRSSWPPQISSCCPDKSGQTVRCDSSEGWQ